MRNSGVMKYYHFEVGILSNRFFTYALCWSVGGDPHKTVIPSYSFRAVALIIV